MNNVNATTLRWILKVSKGIRLKAFLNVVLGISSVLLDFVFIWATKRLSTLRQALRKALWFRLFSVPRAPTR